MSGFGAINALQKISCKRGSNVERQSKCYPAASAAPHSALTKRTCRGVLHGASDNDDHGLRARGRHIERLQLDAPRRASFKRLASAANFLFTLATSNAAASKRRPTHAFLSPWSGCRGSANTDSNSSYPGGPPQSSGGQARTPARHSRLRNPAASSAWTTRSTRMSCTQPSPMITSNGSRETGRNSKKLTPER